MSVGPEEVGRIADLAHLDLSAEEAERLREELNRILEHVDALRALEAGDEPGSSGPTEAAVAGSAQEHGTAVDALQRPIPDFAPDFRETFFVVPPPPGLEHEGDA